MDDSKILYLNDLKDTYISWAKSQAASPDCTDPHELAVITDAIKDIAMAEKYCCEAAYYKAVTEAMEEHEEDEEERAYYRPYRMGYSGGRWPVLNETVAPYANNAWRMDYDDNDWDIRNDNEAKRYGRDYAAYRTAKRNYTATHAEKDRTEMTAEGSRHLMNTISSLKEMWADADPQLRQRMKTDISALIAEMNS